MSHYSTWVIRFVDWRSEEPCQVCRHFGLPSSKSSQRKPSAEEWPPTRHGSHQDLIMWYRMIALTVRLVLCYEEYLQTTCSLHQSHYITLHYRRTVAIWWRGNLNTDRYRMIAYLFINGAGCNVIVSSSSAAAAATTAPPPPSNRTCVHDISGWLRNCLKKPRSWHRPINVGKQSSVPHASDETCATF